MADSPEASRAMQLGEAIYKVVETFIQTKEETDGGVILLGLTIAAVKVASSTGVRLSDFKTFFMRTFDVATRQINDDVDDIYDEVDRDMGKKPSPPATKTETANDNPYDRTTTKTEVNLEDMIRTGLFGGIK